MTETSNALPKSIVVFGQTVKLRKAYDEHHGVIHGAKVEITKSRWSEKFGARILLPGQWVGWLYRKDLATALRDAEKLFIAKTPKTIASLEAELKLARAALRKVSR